MRFAPLCPSWDAFLEVLGALAALEGSGEPCHRLGRLEPPRGWPGQVSLARLTLKIGMMLWVRVMCKLEEASRAVLKPIRLECFKDKSCFPGVDFCFQGPNPPHFKSFFAFGKGRTACVLAQDRAVYQVQYSGHCKAKPMWPDLLRRRTLNSMSTNVDTVELLF